MSRTIEAIRSKNATDNFIAVGNENSKSIDLYYEELGSGRKETELISFHPC